MNTRQEARRWRRLLKMVLGQLEPDNAVRAYAEAELAAFPERPEKEPAKGDAKLA